MHKLVLTGLAALFLAACGQPSGDAGSAKDVASDAKAGADAATAAAVEKASGPDMEALVAAADSQKGSRLFLQCRACHSLEEGGINKVGPNLFGMFGRAAAQAEGFSYSDALKNAGITWDVQTMSDWIERPADLVPGNRMVFMGVRDAKARADLIAYLQQETTK